MGGGSLRNRRVYATSRLNIMCHRICFRGIFSPARSNSPRLLSGRDQPWVVPLCKRCEPRYLPPSAVRHRYIFQIMIHGSVIYCVFHSIRLFTLLIGAYRSIWTITKYGTWWRSVRRQPRPSPCGRQYGVRYVLITKAKQNRSHSSIPNPRHRKPQPIISSGDEPG